MAGDDVGTWVAPHPSRLAARKLWIAFGQPSEGRVHIDAGAMRALIASGKSLLAVGVTRVEGSFDAGDAVEVYGPGERFIGKGLVALPSARLEGLQGKHSSEVGGEVIHRDDLVVLAV